MVLILVIVLVGGYFIFSSPKATAPTPETNTQDTETPGEPVSPTSEMPVPGGTVPEMTVEHTVTYTNSGYSPSELKIKEGETVTWENESTQNMWTASAMHPTHTAYSGTSLSAHCPDTENVAFDACEGTLPGESWSFTFTKAGSWGYHDHLHPTLFGKVIVE